MVKKKKPTAGFFSFTGCEGCQFTVLFIDKIMEILDRFDIRHFHLLKEKNRKAKFGIAFVEGAITSKREIEKLIRAYDPCISCTTHFLELVLE